jgi:hypothetical protein
VVRPSIPHQLPLQRVLGYVVSGKLPALGGAGPDQSVEARDVLERAVVPLQDHCSWATKPLGTHGIKAAY